jgi:uncharacterized protein with HEPN domain
MNFLHGNSSCEQYIVDFVGGVSRSEFEYDLKTISAVIRQFEIIGEASKRLTEEFKNQYPNIPWRQMAGMRDVLIHAYDSVDIDALWNAIEISIPKLIKDLELVLKSS